MKLHLPLVVLLSLCIIASCSKNNDEQPGTDLSQWNITFLDSLTYQNKYERDANNRVLAMQESTAKTGVLMVARVEYNSNGTTKKVTFHDKDSAAVRDYLEFEYNAKGQFQKRTQHSGTTAINEDYDTYAYDDAGHLIIDSQFAKVNGTYQLKYYTNFHYTGNNITEAEMYEVKNGTPELLGKVKYEYDNGLNPFRSVSNEYFFYERSSAGYDVSLLSENNVIKQHEAKGANPYKLLQTIVYDYNANNYPSKLTSTHASNQKMNYSIEYLFQ